jgi:hypothetical protein
MNPHHSPDLSREPGEDDDLIVPPKRPVVACYDNPQTKAREVWQDQKLMGAGKPIGKFYPNQVIGNADAIATASLYEGWYIATS